MWDFSVFLTDDIRAHSFSVSLQARNSEFVTQQRNFAARGSPRHVNGTAARPSERPSIYRSANLGPQATAACSEDTPDAPAKHQTNAIRMIRAGPIYEKNISWRGGKIKDLRPEKAEKTALSGLAPASAARLSQFMFDRRG
ncbi:hypothetical protein [uncultured Methylovirgula sp.]|uniref:hypothetical protein n=1 Tax=uncultured Methylovirgula sp. TaxID=1285960 RepID=UPI00261D1A43|nr:hypothetical protein [uncultured Methylovirgula sp.]